MAMKNTGLYVQHAALYCTVMHSGFLAQVQSVYPVYIQALPFLPSLPGRCFLSTLSNLVDSDFAQTQVLVSTDQLSEPQGPGDVWHAVQRTKALKHPLCFSHFLC